jgi:hypothetical protein
MRHLLLKCLRYDECTAQASTRPFIVSVKRQYLSLTQLLTAFVRCVLVGTLHPRLAVADASVFSCPWRRLRCAAPGTQQAQGLVTARRFTRRLPLASSVPQKTRGALPGPLVSSVQIVWLPCGSTFSRAHGRGVAPLGHAAAGHLSGVAARTNPIGWMSPNFSPSLPPPLTRSPDRSQTLSSPHRARGLACWKSRPVTA